MSLRDTIHEDIDSIFLNEDDFAEVHLLEGIEMRMVVDADDITSPATRDSDIEANTFSLFFRTSDCPLKLREGRNIKYDRKECLIVSYTENYGMTCLRLQQNR